MLKQPVGIAAPSPMKNKVTLHISTHPLFTNPPLPRHIVPGVGSAAGRQSDDDDGDDDEDEEHPTPPPVMTYGSLGISCVLVFGHVVIHR